MASTVIVITSREAAHGEARKVLKRLFLILFTSSVLHGDLMMDCDLALFVLIACQ
jgi:hypothetical protein